MPESDFKGGAFLIFPSPLAEVSPGTAGVVAVNSRTQFNPMKKEKLQSEVIRVLTVRCAGVPTDSTGNSVQPGMFAET
jgi:hypothetical protein